MNWTLADAERRVPEHPTFSIPGRLARHGLRPGDRVKLLFELAEVALLPESLRTNPSGERMWVEITLVRHAMRPGEVVGYTGLLRSDPVVVDAKRGDEVDFGPEHVADFERPRGKEE